MIIIEWQLWKNYACFYWEIDASIEQIWKIIISLNHHRISITFWKGWKYLESVFCLHRNIFLFLFNQWIHLIMIHPYEREDTIARHELVKVEDGFWEKTTSSWYWWECRRNRVLNETWNKYLTNQILVYKVVMNHQVLVSSWKEDLITTKTTKAI